ncbi:MAG: NAD(P)H-binding protein [Gaiella sp.]
MSERDAVTGAFSFTGSFIAAELLERGRQVRTLSRVPSPAHPLAAQVEYAPLTFDESLAKSLAGVDTLYNTYWVRFERGDSTFDSAVANTATLLRASANAGVRRVVQITVANADRGDRFPYFRGKARIEELVRSSGLAHALIRPTLLFGPGDILFNNIAWALRRLPMFLVPGDGRYEVQPVSVRDVARIAADAGATDEDLLLDAAGPSRFTYLDLVRRIRKAVGGRARIATAPLGVSLAVSRLAGAMLRDVVITRDELESLQAGLLVSESPPLGRERVEDWLAAAAATLGQTYTSELRRNFSG